METPSQNDIDPGQVAGRPDAACSAWRLISETQPAIGDIIACCAEHIDGGLMYWAGTVAEINGPWVAMVTRGESERRFVITHDTLWTPLEKPNAQRSGAHESTKDNDENTES